MYLVITSIGGGSGEDSVLGARAPMVLVTPCCSVAELQIFYGNINRHFVNLQVFPRPALSRSQKRKSKGTVGSSALGRTPVDVQ